MVTRLIATILVCAITSGCASPAQPRSVKIAIAGETFSLELALDTPSRVRGLMDRLAIDPHGGMIFVFPDAEERSFWMADCFIDIDLIFLDSRGTITSTHEMKIESPQLDGESVWDYEGRLKHYFSNGPSRFAIELSAGSIDRLELRVNDHISLDLTYLRNLVR